ncbi:MAG: cation-translocating P-type ATPase [Gammaproteobacteria bacterium]|nr:cation-translocating P-type ATPase [Gammaproteobacteria bacterium]
MPGLSSATAAERLAADGPNELPTGRARTLLTQLVDVLREPMVALLVGCGLIYALLGDAQEAAMLLGFLVLIVAITLVQSRRTETALAALRRLSSPRALVLRDGEKRRVAGREVVRGDLLLLAEGDRVAADGVLTVARNLQVDESLLTGESVPVEKGQGERIHAGTTVVRGQGNAEVDATGLATELGRIGASLRELDPPATRLEQETRRVVRVLAQAGLALCVLVVVVYGLTRQDWLGGTLAGLTLAMAILPNELPAVLVVFLALGTRRIAERRVLARNMPAVENLGAATVLCVDKTGTLTLNQMAVRRLRGADGAEIELGGAADEIPLPEEFHALLEFGILASSPAPFDPMERAVHSVGDRHLADTEHLHPDWQLAREHPLSPDLLAVSQAWRGDGAQGYVVGAKGAPEAILDLCHADAATCTQVAAWVEGFAARGLRVLGVARARHTAGTLPGQQHDYDFEFLGLMGLADPVRPQVPEAIARCHAAGIRVVMITGDHAATASAIAREIGLTNPEEVITGPEFETLDDAALGARLARTHCFARMTPAHKLRLVQALAARGEVVAMTGDGVNDAPALRAAHIGIAMGARGTDVAREAAALVLLDDDFTAIVSAVATGRRVFANLRGAMAYLLAVHVPIAGISVLPVLLELPLVLLPVHVALLHLVIEPACSIAFEAEPAAANAMQRPPRPVRAPLFDRDLLLRGLAQGGAALVALFAVFGVALWRGVGEAEARALTFTTLMVANLGLILANRAAGRGLAAALRAPHPALVAVLAGGAALIAATLTLPALRDVLRFGPLHPTDVLLCLVVGSLAPLAALALRPQR